MPITDEIKNKRYRNWNRGARGLFYLQEGLFPFTDRVVKAEHARIVQYLPPCKNCATENILPDHARSNVCFQRNKRKCNCRKRKNRYCPTCSKIYDEIVLQHRFREPHWVTDCSTWYNDHWQFAKCFTITSTEGSNNTAAETDVSELLSIIINGEFFQSELHCEIDPFTGTDIFSQVRQMRNIILNTSRQELMDHEVTRYLQSMIEVLEDKKTISIDPIAQAAVQKLKEILKADETEHNLECVDDVATQRITEEYQTKQIKWSNAGRISPLKRKIDMKKQRSPKDSCIFDGRPIVLEDDDIKWLKETLTFLASGGFGHIYKSTSTDLFGITVAVKKIKKEHDTSDTETNELMVSRIRHQFILPLLATCCLKGEHWFIYPYCENGDLAQAIQEDFKKTSHEMDVGHRVNIMFQIAKAIEYLHTCVDNVRDVIIHKDVASSNVVLDVHYNARLIDFGIAREKNDITNKGCGKEAYTHPEVGHSPAREDWDYFSFGVVIRELLTSLGPGGEHFKYLKNMDKEEIKQKVKTPFKDNEIAEKLNRISGDCLGQDVDFKKDVIEELDALLRQMGRKAKLDGDKCHLCMINPARDTRTHQCINVCVSCEKNSFLNPVRCHCGTEIESAIGHGWGALLVAGDDSNPKIAQTFINDVNKFKKVITSKAPIIMGISDDKVQTVLPDKTEKQSEKILKAVECISKDLRTMIVYFTCHGQNKAGEKDAFTFRLSDSDSITLTEFEDALRQCKKKCEHLNKIMLFFDCCHPRKIHIEGIDTENVIQLNACQHDQETFANNEGSYFTKFLIQGLQAKANGAPCKKDGCKSCQEYWDLRTDYVTVERLLKYINDHIDQYQRPNLLFSGNHDDFKIAFYTDEEVLIEFTMENNETRNLQLQYFSNMEQVQDQLCREFQKKKDDFEIDITCRTFRTDNTSEVCDSVEKVVLAWINRQPLKVCFKSKGEENKRRKKKY